MDRDRICLPDGIAEKALELFVRNEDPGYKIVWIKKELAMQLLGIASETTLQKYRDERLITVSPITTRNILYYEPSIMEFINKNKIERR